MSCKAEAGGGTHCPPAMTRMEPGPAAGYGPRRTQLPLPDANPVFAQASPGYWSTGKDGTWRQAPGTLLTQVDGAVTLEPGTLAPTCQITQGFTLPYSDFFLNKEMKNS